jgi:hypothetical protein
MQKNSASDKKLYASHCGSDGEDDTLIGNNNSIAKEVEECCICTENLEITTIPLKLPCGHIAHHDCLMGVVNGLCPLCRAPIPLEYRKRIVVVEDVFDGKDPPLWMYMSRDNQMWWYYRPDHAKVIEEAYRKMRLVIDAGGRVGAQESTVSLTIHGKQYTIDMVAMIQRSNDGAMRNVKRREPTDEPENIKGVAGAVPK